MDKVKLVIEVIEKLPKAQMAFEGQGEYVPGEWCTFCRAAGPEPRKN